MANNGTFPTPYIDSVPETGDKIMEYTTFPVTGIGARASALPKEVSSGDMTLDHVEDLNGE